MIQRAFLRLLVLTLFTFVGISHPLGFMAPPASRADWPYPRHDLTNTSASDPLKWQLLDTPRVLWQVAAPENHHFGSLFPVAADVDGDGQAEYLIGVNNYTDENYLLYAFNIEDGSVLWQHNVGDWFQWSTPVISDVDSDGQPDVVLATNSQVMALRGDNGSPLWVQPFPNEGMGMTVADVDRDGWLEVVINDYGDPQTIYLLNGQDGSVIWSQYTGGSAYNIPTVGDINGDGRHEILSHSHLYDPSRERLLVWDQRGTELWTHLASPSPGQQAQAPPELGYVPDYGYISTSIADFDADREFEVGWGTRCHYYLLNGEGDVLWQVPMVQGYGVEVRHLADGTTWAENHGIGGPSGYAAAIGNLDTDPQLEVVISLSPEYRADWYAITQTYTITHITPANVIWALDGEDGHLEWAFEGEYPSGLNFESMREPILVDLTADGLLDILAISSDGNLYAVEGDTGDQLMAYPVSDPSPYPWFFGNPGSHLTFVGWEDKGLVLYVSEVCTGSACIATLHALEVAARVFDIYLPVVHKN